MENIDKKLFIECSSKEEVDKVFDYLESIEEKIDRYYFSFEPNIWKYISVYLEPSSVPVAGKWTISDLKKHGENHIISFEEFKRKYISHEYVEYIDTKYKGQIVKVEDWKCGSYCKVIFYNGIKEQPFKHLIKPSTKEAYDAQNRIKLEVGKWYKWIWKVNNKLTYAKCSAISDDCFQTNSGIHNGKYNTLNGYFYKDCEKLELLTDLSEIQEYLPDGHSDKIVEKTTSNQIDWTKATPEELLTEAALKYPIETKFIPNKWCVKITDENKEVLDSWRRKQPRFAQVVDAFYGWLTFDRNDGTYNHWSIDVPFEYSEITFEDFKQNVLTSSILSELPYKLTETRDVYGSNPYEQEPLIEDVQSINVNFRTKKQINKLIF
jgi:hypothetical protein